MLTRINNITLDIDLTIGIAYSHLKKISIINFFIVAKLLGNGKESKKRNYRRENMGNRM